MARPRLSCVTRQYPSNNRAGALRLCREATPPPNEASLLLSAALLLLSEATPLLSEAIHPLIEVMRPLTRAGMAMATTTRRIPHIAP